VNENRNGRISTITSVASFFIAVFAFWFGISDPIENEKRLTKLETNQDRLMRDYEREYDRVRK
jgi:hypothetical protein